MAARFPRVIEVVSGPMFSGKTLHAVLEAGRQCRFGHRVAYISHVQDDRGYDGIACAHNGINVRTITDPGSRHLIQELRLDDAGLAAYVAAALPIDVVIVDEGQFFGDMARAAVGLARFAKRVVVCGLDLDADLVPMGQMLAIPATKKTSKAGLCAVCGCDAPFTARIHPGPRVQVGGSELYRAVCADHHPGFV